MCRKRNVQHRIAPRQQRESIVANISNAVHGVRCHLVHAVKLELLQAKEEAVAPVPRIVLHDSMCIELDPRIERQEKQAKKPADDKQQYAMLTQALDVRQCKERIRSDVIE